MGDSRANGQRPDYLAGTRALNASNQLRTTWICGAAGTPFAPAPWPRRHP